jgi:hypothetical protein
MGDLKYVDLEYVTGLRVGDSDGAGEGMDETAVDVLELVDGHVGVDLRAA